MNYAEVIARPTLSQKIKSNQILSELCRTVYFQNFAEVTIRQGNPNNLKNQMQNF